MAQSMTTGELARAAGGLSLRTIRFYEEKGLLPPPRRTPSGRRIHGPGALTALRKVRVLTESGLSLDEAAHVLRALGRAPSKGKRKLTAHRDALAVARAKLASRRDSLSELIGAVDAALDLWKRCDECGSPDCGGCGRLGTWTRFGFPEEAAAPDDAD